MTKQDVLQEMLSTNWNLFQNAVLKELQALDGLTADQKLQFLSDFVAARETYQRDASAFWNAFGQTAQTKMEEVVVGMFNEEKTALQNRINAIQERIDTLES